MNYLMGLDVGTSSVKCVVIDEKGDVLASCGKDIDIAIPQPDYAEQDPETWWAAACYCIRTVCSHFSEGQKITALGVTGQMHGTVLLDEHLRVLRPAIIWCDQRAAPMLAEIQEKITKAAVPGVENPIVTGTQAATLYWLARYERETFKKIKQVLLPKDYIRFRLTGCIGTDYSDAAATMLFDVRNNTWNAPLIRLLGMELDIFPQVSFSDTLAGNTTKDVERAAGLAAGTPVCYGGGDCQCQAFAQGLHKEGVLLSSVQTGGAVIAISEKPVFDSQQRLLTLNHVIPNQYVQLAATLSGGLSLKWFCNNVLDGLSFKQVDELVQKHLPDKKGPLFLPYLGGERSPIIDPFAKGMFFGLSLNHGKSNMLSAIMEGVIFSLRSCLDLIGEIGLKGDNVIVSGGGAKSSVFLQLWADIFNLPIYRSLLSDQAPIGAAMLAGLATGVFSTIGQASDSICKLDASPVLPRPQNYQVYSKRYELFKSLYLANKNLFREF